MPLFVVFSCVQMAKPKKKKNLVFLFWIKLKKKDFFLKKPNLNNWFGPIHEFG
jgi:hypothetical protein